MYVTDGIPERVTEEMSLSCRRNENPDHYHICIFTSNLISICLLLLWSRWRSNPNEGKTEPTVHYVVSICLHFMNFKSLYMLEKKKRKKNLFSLLLQIQSENRIKSIASLYKPVM